MHSVTQVFYCVIIFIAETEESTSLSNNMMHLSSEETTFKLEMFLSLTEVTSDKSNLNGNIFLCVMY